MTVTVTGASLGDIRSQVGYRGRAWIEIRATCSDYNLGPFEGFFITVNDAHEPFTK